MKILFDFFPVIVFYVAYTVGKHFTDTVQSMIIATALLIAATCIQVAYTWLRKRKVEKMHIVVLVLAIVFGGATIYSHEPTYLVWKVTLAQWLLAVGFFASHFIGDAPLVKSMLNHAFELPEKIWTRLSYIWIAFLTALGAVNLLVYNFLIHKYGQDQGFTDWVNFKLFGMLGLTFAFAIFLSFYLARHAKEKTPEEA